MTLVTSHAISRYRERVEPVSYDEAYARLTTDRIRSHHAVVVDGCIVTVRPKSFTKPKRRAMRCRSQRTGFDQEAAA